MDKDYLEKSFIDSLNKNFPGSTIYFDIKLKVFRELDTLIFEINKCLVLEFDRAAITLTNHLLERLLKLALIYNETGIGPIPTEQWNSVFGEANKKYCSITFSKSIDQCKSNGLISEKEWDYLYNTIRELMRNGFSHADSNKILVDFPEETKVFQGNFKNPSEIKEMNLNQKEIPFLQELNMESFAKEAALIYFDSVIKLVLQIGNRLIEKQKQK